jgi:hypothetical protein
MEYLNYKGGWYRLWLTWPSRDFDVPFRLPSEEVLAVMTLRHYRMLAPADAGVLRRGDVAPGYYCADGA